MVVALRFLCPLCEFPLFFFSIEFFPYFLCRGASIMYGVNCRRVLLGLKTSLSKACPVIDFLSLCSLLSSVKVL